MIRFRGKTSRTCRVALLLAAVGPCLAASPAAAEALYGLVIGINDYAGAVNDLEGAVNDANDIADALRRAGAAEVELLADADATKARIAETWRRLVDAAAPGDTIVFSYAGHGGQEPEPTGRNGEADGLNENFLLGGYAAKGPGSLERIVDDEVFDWLKVADDKGVKVVFVADSCHSGTMYRSVGSASVRYRAGKFEDPDLAGDLLALPDPKSATATESDFTNVTFIAATQDNKLTPELTIDGQPRGALSWAFAKAVRGAADQDRDGHLSQQELLAYLVPTVQAEAENQQIPGILPLRPDRKPIMRSIAGGAASVADLPPEIRVFIRNGDATDLPDVDGAATTADESSADLIWDRAAGTVDHKIGGRVAENVTERTIAAVLSKWSALAFVKARTGADPVSLSVPTGNQTYGRGDIIEFTLDGARYPYLTLFNLPPDGRVAFFMPADPKETDFDWRGGTMSERFRVDQAPFGAEHMVAILTEEPALALHQALRAMLTAEAAGGLAAVLRATLADRPFQAGVVGVYTEGGG